MFEVIYMKADFEPWWMFEEWEEMVRSRQTFTAVEEALVYFNQLVGELRDKYSFEAMKKGCFYAFWCEDEKSFCEGCDDDLQLYHGIIFLKDGQPFVDEIGMK